MMHILRSVALLYFLNLSLLAQPAPPVGERYGGWERVDALRLGTKIVVILENGERRSGHFRGAAADNLKIAAEGPGSRWFTPWPGRERVREETLSKTTIRSVTRADPLSDGVVKGALGVSGGLFVLRQLAVTACRTGCEYDVPDGAALAMTAMTAGIGGLVGLVADRLSRNEEVLYPLSAVYAKSTSANSNRYFPTRSTVRFGPVYRQTAFRSSRVEGSAPAPGFAFAVQLSPYISAQAEYTAPQGRFYAASGSVPDGVLRNLVPPSSRAAGDLRGIESRRVSFVFSELVGVHPPPLGRLRLEFLAGLGVQGQENYNYFDAYQQTGNPIPGKYYVLNFESPEAGLVLGVDAEIALGHGLSVVPSIRYNRFGDPAPSMAYGVTALLRLN